MIVLEDSLLVKEGAMTGLMGNGGAEGTGVTNIIGDSLQQSIPQQHVSVFDHKLNQVLLKRVKQNQGLLHSSVLL